VLPIVTTEQAHALLGRGIGRLGRDRERDYGFSTSSGAGNSEFSLQIIDLEQIPLWLNRGDSQGFVNERVYPH
jgi:hypothetical protein